MADTKITALTAITTVDPAVDVLPIVDVSDTSMAASGTTKKITSNQILGAGGTATLASATITGDLTVDTSTLKVDSANNRVGIRTASPTEPLTVDNSSGVTTGAIRIYATDQSHSRLSIQNGNGQAYHLVAGNPGASNAGFALYDNTAAATRLWIDNTGVHTWQNVGGVAGTAMTLNSTGLGVGVSPAVKLDIGGAATQQFRIQMSGQADTRVISDTGAGIVGTYSNHKLIIRTNSTDAVTVDASQNVGIGVTPSAWSGNYRVLEIGRSGNAFWGQTGVSGVFMSSNALLNSGGSFVYSNTAASTYYTQNTGRHEWYNAPSGTAGNPITFTQAMTLDASGNLLVGTTNSGSNSGIGLKAAYSATAPYFATVGSSNASNTYSYLLYSTTDAAFKFYVSYSGQISATSGTISAISDARLKENVQDIDVGLGAILALKPRKFDWKEGKGKNIKGDRGFIAQEFEQVFPNLIDEWKDESPEGEAPYKSVRQDLIPVLVKAIQELTARVQTLETR